MPKQTMRYVEAYIDRRPFSLGMQRVVIIAEGPKWVEIFSSVGLHHAKMPVARWRQTGPREITDVPMKRIARQALRVLRQYRRLEIFSASKIKALRRIIKRMEA